jgi:hypothetical protein
MTTVEYGKVASRMSAKPAMIAVALGILLVLIGGSLFGWGNVWTAYRYNMSLDWAMRHSPAGVWLWCSGLVSAVIGFGLWLKRAA